MICGEVVGSCKGKAISGLDSHSTWGLSSVWYRHGPSTGIFQQHLRRLAGPGLGATSLCSSAI